MTIKPEDKEIKGISISLLRALIMVVIAVVGPVIASYISLNNGQKDLNNNLVLLGVQSENRARVQDLKISTMEIEIAKIKLDIDKLKEEHNNSK